MAIDQQSQDFIFSVVDATLEYNTKMFIFLIIYAYFIFLLWWSHKIIPFNSSRETKMQFPVYQQFSVKLMRIASIPFLVLLPLIISIFMYRDFDIDEMIRYLIIGYTLAVPMSFGIWFIFGLDWVMDFLKLANINIKQSKGTFIRRRK